MSEVMNVWVMNVGQSKNWNQCKWRYLVAKFITNASDANCWPNFQPMQVAPPGAKIGTNTSEATFKLISVRKNDSSYRVNTLGPLCLWQCFSECLDMLDQNEGL